MGRKKKHEEHVNHERWLVSYADFVTLLFAFFVILYATGQTDDAKVKEFEHSVQQELSHSIIADFVTQFAYSKEDDPRRYLDMLKKKPSFEDLPVRRASSTVNDSAAAKKAKGATTAAPKEWSVLATLNQDLNEVKLKPEYQKHLKFQMDERKLVIRLGEAGFFHSGTPEFTAQAEAVLDSIGGLLKKYAGVEITIEGHTDNLPIRNSIYRSNWELSTARATIVISYLITRHAIDPMRLVAAGYGEFRPLASNDHKEGRAQNRRVDIIVRNPSDDVKMYWENTVERRLREAKAKMAAQQDATNSSLPEPPALPNGDGFMLNPSGRDTPEPSPFDAPADDAPGDDAPGDDAPADDAPADDAPADDAPADDAPADDAPADDAPADDAPADDAPADDAPADDAPADFTPTDDAPVDSTPADDAPVDPGM
jgi:chemotaxis protein MotB